jgi:hypothetical protein
MKPAQLRSQGSGGPTPIRSTASPRDYLNDAIDAPIAPSTAESHSCEVGSRAAAVSRGAGGQQRGVRRTQVVDLRFPPPPSHPP